jgi:hexosaminidase
MIRTPVLLLGTLLSAAGGAPTPATLASRGYAVLPAPREVALEEGDLRLSSAWSLALGPGISSNDAAVEALDEGLREYAGLRRGTPQEPGTAVRLEMREGSVAPGESVDRNRAEIAAQAYRIEIGGAGVAITANAPEGLFYGVETLVQLARRRGGAVFVPRGRITDWPDLHRRHIYWDDAHHLEPLAELKRAVRQAAFFKINGFALKLEGHFQFHSAPAVVEPHALSPAEYQELTDYGLRYHVQVIPYLDGPAHIAFILKHPEYAKYREFPDSNYELCATNPEAVALLKGMFRDLIDANRGGRFVYLSTDEPYYIGLADNAQCREKAAAAQKGSVGRLLADFIAQVAEPMHRQGRTVLFWGEYPLVPSDIEALPPYLVNGETYGPLFDPLFRKRGIREMIYTSTQGEEPLFPKYFPTPDSRQLHQARREPGRVADGIEKISHDSSRMQSDLTGAVVAGWGDTGLHPETFWLGYTTIAAAAWHPGAPAEESAEVFYRQFYGGKVTNMNRVYQLLSQQAQFWFDSWEFGESLRKPIFGYHAGIYNPRKRVKEQVLPLPPLPAADLKFDSGWLKDHARRLELASTFLSDNDELLGLLYENLGRVERNRYNLEVFLSVARLCRQNLEMLLDLGRMCALLEAAGTAGGDGGGKHAVESVDRALELAWQIRRSRNLALHNAVTTWYRSWLPRVPAANGRRFLHELDDVKDHLPDRTVDMSYLVYRELQLPFGQWVEGIRGARNRFAAAHSLASDERRFDWADLETAGAASGR